jgi:Fe2+ or Zn2+ uptake regulation protein
MLVDRERVLEVIRQKFVNKDFTMGDIYYALETTWNKSKFGSIFNTIKAFTQQGILTYEMKLVGTPTFGSPHKRHGAVYRLIA